MKYSELRLDNLIYFNDEVAAVGYLDKREVGKLLPFCKGVYSRYLFSWKSLKPIPLTEKWLESFGFEKIQGWMWKSGISLRPKSEFIDLEYGGYILDAYDIHIDYVHTLQNLYFALTGEELKLKEEIHESN